MAKKLVKEYNVSTAVKSAANIMEYTKKLLADDPIKFAALEVEIKAEALRLRGGQAVLKVLSGKNVNEKCYEDVKVDAEVVDSELVIVQGTKKVFDQKTGLVKDVIKYDAPATVAMRDAKKVALLDEDSQTEVRLTLNKYDQRMDNSTAVSTQLSQMTRGIRDAKRSVKIAEDEAKLAAKNITLRKVAALGELMGFAKVVRA